MSVCKINNYLNVGITGVIVTQDQIKLGRDAHRSIPMANMHLSGLVLGLRQLGYARQDEGAGTKGINNANLP